MSPEARDGRLGTGGNVEHSIGGVRQEVNTSWRSGYLNKSKEHG